MFPRDAERLVIMLNDLIPFLALPLLLLVLGGYYWTVFEPYRAHLSAEGLELMQYFANDRKLQIIAEYWASRLCSVPTKFFDEEDDEQSTLKNRLIHELTIHRLRRGDDDSRLIHGPKSSRLLARACQASKLRLPEPDGEIAMLIAPNMVSLRDGRVLWRGRPQEYKSRFCDFYPEP